jgi:hypothetical protein
MVKGKEPVGVLPAVVTVSVDEPDPPPYDVGENTPDAPAGSPATE